MIDGSGIAVDIRESTKCLGDSERTWVERRKDTDGTKR